jgi:hypothetical protein
MAYPMMYCPPWGEMRADIIEKYGVTVVKMGDGNGFANAYYLQRQVGGETHIYPFPVLMEDGEIVTPGTVRILCDYLRLPKADFGLTIEEDNPVVIE